MSKSVFFGLEITITDLITRTISVAVNRKITYTAFLLFVLLFCGERIITLRLDMRGVQLTENRIIFITVLQYGKG
jgi:hypothetical protein